MGLRRGQCVSFSNSGHLAEKLLKSPAVYMKPHKNALADETLRRKKFKPKIMLGDIRKPSC